MAKAKKKAITDPVFKAIADYTAQAQQTNESLEKANKDREKLKKDARRLAAASLESRIIHDQGGYVMPDDMFVKKSYDTHFERLMRSVDGKVIEFCEATSSLHKEAAGWKLIETPPTTLDGVITLLNIVLEREAVYGDEILNATRELVGGKAQQGSEVLLKTLLIALRSNIRGGNHAIRAR